MAIFFFVGPAVYMARLVPIKLILFIWLGTLLSFLHLNLGERFSIKDLGPWQISKKEFKPVLKRFLFFGSMLFLWMLIFMPEELFSFPRENTGRWLLVLIFYPLLSILPQTFIYRVYLTKKYGDLFSTQRALVLFGTLAFGYAHLIMHNWIAVLITTIGGLIFMNTYLKSRSFLLSFVEQSLYACLAVTLGYGRFISAAAAGY